MHQRWNPLAPLLVLDEIHKMPDWKAWLKGVVDGKPATQQLLVTGSARMDTFRQSGESLAGRFFGLRLHPISVREWCAAIKPGPRLMQQAPKVYFYDTGLVEGDEGLRFENLVATALHKHVQWQHDVQGQETGLHYIRTKDGAEVDFALSNKGQLSHLVECKLTDPKPHRALQRFAREQPQAQAVQVVRHLPHSHALGEIQVVRADEYLNGLAA